MIYCSILLQNAGCSQYLKDVSELLLKGWMDHNTGTRQQESSQDSMYNLKISLQRYLSKILFQNLPVALWLSVSGWMKRWCFKSTTYPLHPPPHLEKTKQNSLPASLQPSHVIPCPSFFIQVATKINSKSVQLFTWSNTEASGLKSWRRRLYVGENKKEATKNMCVFVNNKYMPIDL